MFLKQVLKKLGGWWSTVVAWYSARFGEPEPDEAELRRQRERDIDQQVDDILTKILDTPEAWEIEAQAELDELFGDVMDSLSAKYLPGWVRDYIALRPEIRAIAEKIEDELSDYLDDRDNAEPETVLVLTDVTKMLDDVVS